MPEILQKPKLLSLLTHAEVSGGTKTRQISAVVCLFVWKAGDLKENALQSSSMRANSDFPFSNSGRYGDVN